MKKTLLLIVLLLTTSLSAFSQTNKKVNTPEDIGMYAFKVLKKLERISDKEFIYSFLTIEEIKAYTTKHIHAEESSIKKEINQTSTEEYHLKVTEEYTNIQEKAKSFNIKWSTIEYVDFTYEEKSEGGYSGLVGKLLFKHNDIIYYAKVEALLMEKKYAPVVIRNLSKNSD